MRPHAQSDPDALLRGAFFGEDSPRTAAACPPKLFCTRGRPLHAYSATGRHPRIRHVHLPNSCVPRSLIPFLGSFDTYVNTRIRLCKRLASHMSG